MNIVDEAALNNTIFIVDDDAEILESYQVYFEFLGFKTQTFSSAVDYIKQLDDTPGCLVCDISMPNMTGIGLLSELNKDEHLRPVVFLTGVATIEMAVEAMQLGAAGFIEKPDPEDKLLGKVLDAIEKFKPSLSAVNDYKRLTNRECKVFDLIVGGVVNKDIAEQLDITISTVEKHRSSVMRKMQAESLADLLEKLPYLKPLGSTLAFNNL